MSLQKKLKKKIGSVRFGARQARDCLLCLLGSAILAFGLYNVHAQSGISEGGTLGLTLLLRHWLSLSPALTGAIFNALCYLLGFFVLGRAFIFYSCISGIGFSLFYALFERLPPLFSKLPQYPLEAAVLGAVFVGVGVGLCVLGGGAPSGDDALAMSLSRITGKSISLFYLLTDLSVLTLSLTYIPPKRIFWSLLTVLLSGQLIGFIERIPQILSNIGLKRKKAGLTEEKKD